MSDGETHRKESAEENDENETESTEMLDNKNETESTEMLDNKKEAEPTEMLDNKKEEPSSKDQSLNENEEISNDEAGPSRAPTYRLLTDDEIEVYPSPETRRRAAANRNNDDDENEAREPSPEPRRRAPGNRNNDDEIEMRDYSPEPRRRAPANRNNDDDEIEVLDPSPRHVSFNKKVIEYKISPIGIERPEKNYLDRCCTLWNVTVGFAICLAIIILIYLVIPDSFGDFIVGDFIDPPVDHDHPDMMADGVTHRKKSVEENDENETESTEMLDNKNEEPSSKDQSRKEYDEISSEKADPSRTPTSTDDEEIIVHDPADIQPVSRRRHVGFNDTPTVYYLTPWIDSRRHYAWTPLQLFCVVMALALAIYLLGPPLFVEYPAEA